MDVIDLHSDLLSYLANDPNRTSYDLCARSSIPQLDEGNVTTQILAIFTDTNTDPLNSAAKQIESFLKLQKTHPTRFFPAFENASGFCKENEPLQTGLDRFDAICKIITPVYISLTWNGENRFGGGTGSPLGLKNDGKELLRYLSQQKVAIDLSHASDTLARDILNFIDKENLSLDILASHSNFRSIVDHERNLPDDIAREIICRKGLIGLVFYKKFLGSPTNLEPMIAHGHKLGGENALAFGADFFCLEDLTYLLEGDVGFFDELSASSCYQKVLQSLPFSLSQLTALASDNAKQKLQTLTYS